MITYLFSNILLDGVELKISERNEHLSVDKHSSGRVRIGHQWNLSR